MSQLTTIVTAASMGAILTLTGDSGGAVSPDGGGNINVVGGTGITTTGSPGTNTITIESNPLETIIGFYALNSAGPIATGTPVAVNGIIAGTPSVYAVDATATDECDGIAYEDIDGSPGFIITCGRMSPFDTSTLGGTGAPLYVSAVGGLTQNRPTGPADFIQVVGFVEISDVAGSLMVNVTPHVTELPNIPDDAIWIGDPSNQPSAVTLSTGVLSYNAAANTMASSTLTQNAVLYGGASNAISSTGVGTDGQLIIGATGAAPAYASLTSTGGTITITPGANTLNIDTASAGFTWNEETGTSANMDVNNGYIANNAGLVTLTLPAVAVVGDEIRVVGKGAGGWRVAQNAGQTLYIGSSATTTGAGGRLDSTDAGDCISFVCITANNDFRVFSSMGNITVT